VAAALLPPQRSRRTSRRHVGGRRAAVSGKPGADGGDSWNWSSAILRPDRTRSPPVQSCAGLHDTGYRCRRDARCQRRRFALAWSYLDPGHPPKEVMLMWNDVPPGNIAPSGARRVTIGTSGTAAVSQPDLFRHGQWCETQRPSRRPWAWRAQVLSGMGFTQFDGAATWNATWQDERRLQARGFADGRQTPMVPATDCGRAHHGKTRHWLPRIQSNQHGAVRLSRLVNLSGAERRGRGRSNPHHWICNQRHRLKADVDPRRRPDSVHLWGRGCHDGPRSSSCSMEAAPLSAKMRAGVGEHDADHAFSSLALLRSRRIRRMPRSICFARRLQHGAGYDCRRLRNRAG